MIFWCDSLAYFSLLFLMALLPFAKAGVKVCASLAILFFLLKKASQVRQALALPAPLRGAALRGVGVLPFRAAGTEWAALAYLAACFMGVLLSQFPMFSIYAFFGKILEVVFLFVIVQEVLVAPVRIRWFIRIFFLAAFVLCLDAFWQLAVGRDLFRGMPMILGRVGASMKHPNDLAGYLLNIILPGGVMAGVSFRAWSAGKSGKTAGDLLLWGIFFLVTLACFGITYSRGAWVAMIAAMVLMVILRPQYWKVLAVGVGVLTVFVFLMMTHRSDMKSRGAATQTEAMLDPAGRTLFWSDAITIFKMHPVVGTGLNTYTEAMKARGGMSGWYAHNCYLQMAAELGLIGVGAFLWFMISVLVIGARRIEAVVNEMEKTLLYAFWASWAGLMVHGALDTTFYSGQHWPLIWLMAGFLMVAPVVLKHERLD